MLKGAETNQESALLELVEQGFPTAKGYRVKELLRWVRRAESKQAAKWRITHFLKHATEYAANCPLLEPVRGSLANFERRLPQILHRWHSLNTNARLECSMACSKQRGPEPGDTGTWKILSPWST